MTESSWRPKKGKNTPNSETDIICDEGIIQAKRTSLRGGIQIFTKLCYEEAAMNAARC